jgi:hypothetical protein
MYKAKCKTHAFGFAKCETNAFGFTKCETHAFGFASIRHENMQNHTFGF